MSAELLWFRLRQGKVWHLACGGASVALCGEALPERGERQPKRPPFGGRACPSCAEVSGLAAFALEEAERVRLAQLGSPTPVMPPGLYEHDLTDPEGLLSDEEYGAQQQVSQADAEFRDRMEMVEGQP